MGVFLCLKFRSTVFVYLWFDKKHKHIMWGADVEN
jgi:hypothetical protein